MANNVKGTIASAAGNTFNGLLVLACIAFCAGVPIGMAAREFSHTMLSPNVTVSPDQ